MSSCPVRSSPMLCIVPPQQGHASGAEVDLVLELPGKHGIWAIEIKRSSAVRVEKGFHIALEDIKSKRSYVVYSGQDRYPINKSVEGIGVNELAGTLAAIG